MEYSREQELIPAADYPPDKQMQAELHLIDIQEEKANAVQLEAVYVARRIARLMTDGSTVWENGAPRPGAFWRCLHFAALTEKQSASLSGSLFERGDQQLVRQPKWIFTGKRNPGYGSVFADAG